MKRQIIGVTLASLCAAQAMAEIDAYGKVNASLQQTKEGDDSFLELESNASRLGVKGEEELNENLKAIYRIEVQYATDDGDPGNGSVFSARNIYVGVEGDFGQVVAGRMDTPLKVIQSKVDVFNDMAGDIGRIITASDNRVDNFVQYTTPDSIGPFIGKVGIQASEEDGVDNGVSVSAGVHLGEGLFGFGYDQDIEAESVKVFRVAGEYDFGLFSVAGLWEDQDPGETAMNDATGWLVSSRIKLAEDWGLGVQYGQSDIVEEGGETYGAKLDWTLTDNTYVYAFHLQEESDQTIDNSYTGIGVEMKF